MTAETPKTAEITTPTDPKTAMMYWHERAMEAERDLTAARAQIAAMQSVEVASDHVCKESDGCPTELVVLKREWREMRARVAELEAGLRTSLESVQNTLEAAYHNCTAECCGRAGYECCGNTVQTWTAEDQRTMDVLGPVERSLRALLSPSPEPTK